MAVFNVSFLNPKLRKSSGGGASVGILADQLSILENDLGRDGYLAPGDYDILIEQANKAMVHPSLSASQRSDYKVRVARYEREKAAAANNLKDDLGRMNRAIKSEAAENVMMVGNNPQEFLRGRVASLRAKLNDLADIIERKTASGADVSEYNNEYQETLRELQNKVEIQNSLGGVDQTNPNPIFGYAAYVATNNNGEIIDVDYDRIGNKSGYAETNGLINGLQIYGKINHKQDGKNYFKLGNKLFSAVDMLKPDPNNPGVFTTERLVADVPQDGMLKIGEGGYISMQPQDIPTQSYLPRNSWAKGINGTLYKRGADGGYTRYLNVNQSMYDMPPLDQMVTIPKKMERSLMGSYGRETFDAAEPIKPDKGMSFISPESVGLGTGGAPMSMEPQKNNISLERTKAPAEKASSGIMETAGRTIKSGIDYLKSVF